MFFFFSRFVFFSFFSFYVFSKLFFVFLFFFFFFSFWKTFFDWCCFDCKYKSLTKTRRKQTNTERNRNTTEKLREKHKQATEIQDIQPSTRPRINISQGWIYCISVFLNFIFLEAFLLFSFYNVYFCFFCFMCSPSLFKILHLQSNKHISYNNRTNTEKASRKT